MDITKPLQIGKIETKNRLFLAPMVDVTDVAYREICRKCGAGMAYTEMIYIDAILHKNKKTLGMMKKGSREKPLGIQITGNSEEEFERVISYLKDYDLVDINCGCPSMRITGNNSGSFLLQEPEKIARIVRLMKKADLTVTVKIRLGFKENNVFEVARAIEKAGADGLTVHARLSTQGSRVPADWKWIKHVKESVKIPVIGNGDVFSGKSAERMLRETGCDGVMMGRGAIGDPLIFSRVLNYFANGEEGERDWKENFKLFGEYLKLARKYDIIDMGHVKYLGGNFLKGFSGASKLRSEFMQLKDFEQVEGFVERVLRMGGFGIAKGAKPFEEEKESHEEF